MNKNIYIFSGLGADERAFSHLDFSSYNVHFIKWIPVEKDDSLERYAMRLLSQIEGTKPVLIGLSFGGIMAIEVAKQIEAGKVIIISSAKNKNEIPFYYRFIGKLNLHKLIPSRIFLKSNRIINYIFGITSTSDQQLFKQILLDTNPLFLKWAIDKIIKWKNTYLLSNLYHIHGENDKILPYYFINANYAVKDGGHLMIISKHKEVWETLRLQLENSN
ncbi:alpha/beta hydrolase [Dysgonomonas macrotermitis]|uniref:Pimeloyl-ACP methyl ester carboxylesterase n=1 Tax=Dysgonomonas macrotermitis TaxID=1346286 RepID=A0A1M4XCR7_9BACT|nr:alpha/beta hydrolase [Dysgonomonas macrotermitis]SHE91379.1 hypothetical protein SAMN05444362_102477 [Dysgonomonas macrotermitis]